MDRAPLDVAVIGAGPAGAACALALARLGRSVALIERSDYDRFRVGETLPSSAKLSLERLGLWPRFLALSPVLSLGIQSAWGSSELVERDHLFNPYGSGWHIDRQRFDQTLAEFAADAGVRVSKQTNVRRIRRESGSFRIQLDDRGTVTRTLNARLVVDATGGGAAIARGLGAAQLFVDRTSAEVAVASPGGPAWPSTLLIESVEEGWWYSVPLPGGRLLVTLIGDPPLAGGRVERKKLFLERLGRTVHTARRVGSSERIADLHTRTAMSGALEPAAGTDWLAVGDAASTWDPLAAMGISKALTSAEAGARAIDAALAGERSALSAYSAQVHRDFLRYLGQRETQYRLEKRFTAAPFWRARQHFESSFAENGASP